MAQPQLQLGLRFALETNASTPNQFHGLGPTELDASHHGG